MQLSKLRIKYESHHYVPLEADESFWDATKDEIDLATGGCGPGWAGDWFVPDTVWGGLSILRACRIHDWDYRPGSGVSKEVADKRFYENMQRIIIVCTKWNWLKNMRLRQAKLYYLAVKYGGDSSYAEDKNNKKINLA